MLKKSIRNVVSKSFSLKTSFSSSPIEDNKNFLKKSFLSGWTKHALNLYVRQNDIKKFSQLVLSNPEDTSHNEMVKDILSDKRVFSQLLDNEKFLKDLDLD